MKENNNLITATSVNPQEVLHFSRLAEQWWDPKGKFRVLHKFNPVRLEFIIDQICHKFSRQKNANKPLAGLRILDVGCGGGLLCEPLARLGAQVLGIDVTEKNIEVAKIHAKEFSLDIDYQAISLEELLKNNSNFDVVLTMEVVEHVDNVSSFIKCCTQAVTTDGLLLLGTLNRTFKAWLLAIVAAENILGWLPKGTHNIDKFLKPEEIKAYLSENDFVFLSETGIIYNLFYDRWELSKDMDINYILSFAPKIS